MNAPVPPPQDEHPVRPGDVLAGKYRVERLLGGGERTVVIETRHLERDERVALKLLLPEHAQQPEAAAQFLREAQAAAQLEGEHAVRVSEVGVLESGAPYLVMELLEGLDLADLIERQGVCQILDAVDYLLQACEAIAEAHAHGILHCDLRPANLFLTHHPDGAPMIKVLDIGFTKRATDLAGELTPSALYMAPEQVQPEHDVDHRADIYALGISLYELLAGKPPFQAGTLRQLLAEVLTGKPTPIHQLRADVPHTLAYSLARAYARDRELRYQNIAELAAALASHAPPRSQTSLDRIAQMAGLPPAVASGRPPPSFKSDLPPRAIGFASLPAAPPAPPAPLVYSIPDEIPIGGYQGPVSRRAAAAFAASASTGPEPAPTSGGAVGSRSGLLAIIAAIAIGTGLLLGAVAYFLLRGRADPGKIVPPPASVSVQAPMIPFHAPLAEPGASAADSPDPAVSASASATAPAGTTR